MQMQMLSKIQVEVKIDPTGKSDDEFQKTARMIEHKILELKESILSKSIMKENP